MKSISEKISSLLKNFLPEAKNSLSNFLKKIFYSLKNANWRGLFSSIVSFFSIASRWIGNFDWRNRNSGMTLAVAALVIISAVFTFSKFFANRIDTEQSVPVPPQNDATPANLDDIQVKNVSTIEEIAKLPQGSHGIVFLSDNLFFLSGNKSVVKIDPANKEAEQTDANVESGKFSLATAMPNLGTIFIFTDDKKIISYTPINKRFQENSIALPDNFSASDMKTYLTYLYFLDSKANQIFRYPRAEGGFGERQNWLKSGEDVKNSIGFGINDDLFIASADQISAYLRGRRDGNINFENPNTPLSIDKIFTAPDLESIYVLDNKNRRVVQYSKDGKIAAQYFNASLSGIKDLAVNEKNKIIYLQKTDSVLKFSME